MMRFIFKKRTALDILKNKYPNVRFKKDNGRITVNSNNYDLFLKIAPYAKEHEFSDDEKDDPEPRSILFTNYINFGFFYPYQVSLVNYR